MADYWNAGQSARFNCGSYILIQNLRAFDPSGFTIAFWARWRDPNFMDPCFVENPGESPIWTTSASSAWVFCYNDYQDPSQSQGGSRLTLSVPQGLTVWNTGASCSTGISLTDKQFHFIAFAFKPLDAQNDQVTSYLDGVQTGVHHLYHDQGWGTPNGKTLGLGCQYADGGQESRFCGNLAEFQIWAGQLDAAKLSALMDNPPDPAAEPQLRLLMPLSLRHLDAESVGKYCGSITAQGFGS